MRSLGRIALAVATLTTAFAAAFTASGRAPDPEPGPDRICPGGLESRLGVELVPRQTVQGKAGEALEVGVRLESRFDAAAKARYAVEFVDDRGKAWAPPAESPVVALDKAGAIMEAAYATPPGLPDGYYELRVTAAATDEHDEAAEVLSQYLLVAGGAPVPVEAEEFFANSAANEGVPL
jgi:hypothetical protein